MAKIASDENTHFYVQISDSAAVRKSLLSNSKQVIQLLKRYEQLKMIRSRKMEELLKLRKTNKEINILITKMKKMLPKADLRVKLTRESKVKPAAKVQEQQQMVPANELQRLEAELRDIESKINKIE